MLIKNNPTYTKNGKYFGHVAKDCTFTTEFYYRKKSNRFCPIPYPPLYDRRGNCLTGDYK